MPSVKAPCQRCGQMAYNAACWRCKLSHCCPICRCETGFGRGAWCRSCSDLIETQVRMHRRYLSAANLAQIEARVEALAARAALGEPLFDDRR